MFPGAFASNNPRAVVLAGGGFFRAGPDGLLIAQFAWADPETMLARNQPAGLLGLVAPVAGFSRRLSVERGVSVRPYYGVTLFSAGDFYVRFPEGAEPLQQVFAGELDGEPISGEADGALPTPWYVVTRCPPGGIAIISTWSTPQ